MALTWNAIDEGIQDARRTIQQADRRIGSMANLIRGRLRSGRVARYILVDLKRELRDYNIHTGKWR